MGTKKNLPVKKKAAAVSNPVTFNKALVGAEADVDNEDILIPKLHLMQKMSELVDQNKAVVGEFRDSLEGELIAGLGESLDMVVISSDKMWQWFTVDAKGKAEYQKTTNFYDNPGLAINEELEDGTLVHRDKVLRFTVLLMKELAAGMAFPYVIDFKKTSRQNGQKLSTQFAKLRSVGMPSYAKVFSLTAEKKSNDKGSWLIPSVSTGRNVTQEEVGTIEGWVATMLKHKENKTAVVDESDVVNNVVNVDSDQY